MRIFITWSVLIAAPLILGGLVARFCGKRHAVLISGICAWLVFLVVNILSERASLDYEIVQGTWPLFQLTIGTGVALLGMLGAFVYIKKSERES